ncbi:hypothetical protein [Stenotrophomonas sp. S41]|uniref:hypothetical protein n=1 Tax=Stenotrophomonas sp. S41 TaxID=2767464 RepID=UPI00190E5721|nr:hypothetical protein [Stenotrophomonas sp. S41]MBK0010816.1 hypothetical protein [Stenotrophomonas sp. S41]
MYENLPLLGGDEFDETLLSGVGSSRLQRPDASTAIRLSGPRVTPIRNVIAFGALMERMIKDEGFVGRALAIATNEDGRWVANQAEFDGVTTDKLSATAHAALVTAVGIYCGRNLLSGDYLERALTTTTVGEARALIDELKPIIDGQ